MKDIERCKTCPDFKYKTDRNELCLECIEDEKRFAYDENDDHEEGFDRMNNKEIN